MAQQREGWPLGLQPLMNMRNGGFDGSISFNTLITSSSSHSSSDLDTESTASFFHDKSITLGSLIGITSILEFSRRSTRSRTIVETKIRDPNKKVSSNKSRTRLFSLCSKLNTDAVSMNNNINSAPSLGHFLEAERKATATYGLDDFNQLSNYSNVNNNSLFIGGQIAPPHDESSKGLFEQNDQSGHHGSHLIFSCLCGHLVH
ncbi:hypothetical protein P3S67_000576 [Capsicum chacoense]